MNAVQKLRSIADEIAAGANALEVQNAWALAARLLSRMPVDHAEAERVLKQQDAAGLDAIVSRLENPGKPAAAGQGGGGGAAAAADANAGGETTGGASYDDLAAAMRAFKKRLKLVRLNDESKLGGRQLSGGKKSEVDAIMAPTGFDKNVWNELVNQGRLIDTGQGFYKLP